jgi:hypothetical protein
MTHAFRHGIASLLTLITVIGGLVSIESAYAVEPTVISLGDGKIEMTAPAGWEKVAPRVRIIEYEFNVPAVKGDGGARATIMGAGGSVDANVKRWLGQFSKTTKSDVTKEKVAGQEVHFVDIAGTYADRRGPFAPAVERKGYCMLAAIIVTEKAGKYFVKFYGPENTVDGEAKAFRGMIDSLKVK